MSGTQRLSLRLAFSGRLVEVLDQLRCWAENATAEAVRTELLDALHSAILREHSKPVPLAAGVCPFGKIEDCGDSGYHADRSFTKDPPNEPAPESTDPYPPEHGEPVAVTPYLPESQLFAGS